MRCISSFVPLAFIFPGQMSTRRIDALRSTRSRVAKMRHRSQECPKPSASTEVEECEVLKRDFSRYFGDRHPLRIIFVGHNPSAKSWEQVAPYAHSTNKFWGLLKEVQLAPPDLCKPSEHKELPPCCGIGFIDLFITCGSDASKVKPTAIKNVEWKKDFFDRLVSGTGGVSPLIICCVSKIVAKKLLGQWNDEFGHVGFGRDWNLRGAETSEVWVLPSTSGRAGLTFQARLEPFQNLAVRCSALGKWINDDATKIEGV